jgi:hypothetical protein
MNRIMSGRSTAMMMPEGQGFVYRRDKTVQGDIQVPQPYGRAILRSDSACYSPAIAPPLNPAEPPLPPPPPPSPSALVAKLPETVLSVPVGSIVPLLVVPDRFGGGSDELDKSAEVSTWLLVGDHCAV